MSDERYRNFVENLAAMPSLESLRFPLRVVIDDKCDGCGPEARGQFGVSFGADKPVLCSVCARLAVRLFDDWPPPFPSKP